MQIINIQTINSPDNLGRLSFFEAGKDIPFEIRRVYYTYYVPKNSKRGGHAHKNLKQMIFCICGEIEIILDYGIKKESIILNDPSIGIIIGSGVWRDLIWKKENSVLCVMASEYYNEKDYIRDYNEFLSLVKKGYWK